MGRVADRVALVTGGSLGLGHATCLMLGREGASVAVTDVNDEPGRATAEAIREAGGAAEYWHLDVTDEDQLQQVIDAAAGRFGGLDILVNNAGISGINRPTDEIPQAEWDRVMDVNVKGVFLCTKHAIAHMRRRGGGSIVNLSSIYGLVGAPDLPPYHASKAAVWMMSRTDALLYAADNIRVNSIHPAYIWTPMVEQIGREDPDGVEAFRQRIAAKHPLGHIGEPDDIAYAVLYLASDESKFVTGSALVIDGGYTAR